MVPAAAVVIVQIVPPASAEHLGDRLITACTQGLRQGACVLAGDGAASQRATLTAEVTWTDDDFRVAVVRVGKPGAAESAWISGKVAFDDDDAITDRWTTAGFTIATLIGDLAFWTEETTGVLAPEEPATSEPSSASPPPPVRDEAPVPQLRHVVLRSTGGLAVGQGMHGQTLRAGPWASLSYAPLKIPAAILVRGAVAWSAAENVSVRWATVAVGLEGRWPGTPSHGGFLLAADGGLSRIAASDQQTASRVSVAYSMFAGGEVVVTRAIGLVLGIRIDTGPTTHLDTRGERVFDRRFKIGGVFGVAVRL